MLPVAPVGMGLNRLAPAAGHNARHVQGRVPERGSRCRHRADAEKLQEQVAPADIHQVQLARQVHGRQTGMARQRERRQEPAHSNRNRFPHRVPVPSSGACGL